MIVRYDEDKISFKQSKSSPIKLYEDSRYIISVGSVGQPRDNDPRAGYIIWDSTSSTLEIRRIEYQIDLTANKILERGFEKKDAKRLYRNSKKSKSGESQ